MMPTAALDAVMCSASDEDSATVACFLDDQDITLDPS